MASNNLEMSKSNEKRSLSHLQLLCFCNVPLEEFFFNALNLSNAFGKINVIIYTKGILFDHNSESSLKCRLTK